VQTLIDFYEVYLDEEIASKKVQGEKVEVAASLSMFTAVGKVVMEVGR